MCVLKHKQLGLVNNMTVRHHELIIQEGWSTCIADFRTLHVLEEHLHEHFFFYADIS